MQQNALTTMPKIAFLSHADTDLAALVRARYYLPADFSQIVGVNLQNIADDKAMDLLLETTLKSIQIVVLRVLGKTSSIAGFSKFLHSLRKRGVALLPISGTSDLSAELAALASVDPALLAEAYTYMQAGGASNIANLCLMLSDRLLMSGFSYAAPVTVPEHGIYHPLFTQMSPLPLDASIEQWQALRKHRHAVAIIFYRAHWVSGNLQFIDSVIESLDRRGLDALPIFTSSLKSRGKQTYGKDKQYLPCALELLYKDNNLLVQAIINTTSFAMADINPDGPTLEGWSIGALSELNLPVIQAILSSMKLPVWQESTRGLNPLDAAMNIVMPEFDGRITTVPISFKELSDSDGIELSSYVPLPDRIERLVGLVTNIVRLRILPNAEKRIAFVLTNASSKASQIGNAVGLDAPASLMVMFNAMKLRGYEIANLPISGDQLIHNLIDKGCYDQTLLSSEQCNGAFGRISTSVYREWFETLTAIQKDKMTAQWGDAPGEAYLHDGDLIVAGLDLGNVALLIQPPRGYGMDPDAIYHKPDLAPTHHYCATYFWLTKVWKADAIVHMGKHGTLEWLPGKATGLSEDCFPDVVLGDLPLFYPFIINDPGEGCQAKRRSHAVIVDHLTPPMTTADTYGVLNELVQLVDEYYQLELVDPGKLPLLQKQIWELIERANLQYDLQHLLARELHDHENEHEDEHKHEHKHEHDHDHEHAQPLSSSNLASLNSFQVSHLIQTIDGYLCELGAAQIRDGLHILGKIPVNEQLVDLLCAMTRLRNISVPSLYEQVAHTLNLNFEELNERPGDRLTNRDQHLEKLAGRPILTNSDALEIVEFTCHKIITDLSNEDFDLGKVAAVLERAFDSRGVEKRENIQGFSNELSLVLNFICTSLVPKLKQSDLEITNLLNGLDGGYVPAGPSGAPTRGMAHILPTGRNFYAVDPSTLPSYSAWLVGEQLATLVLAQYLAETNVYPQMISISMWGTSAMRTHGDDVAEVLALLGIKPNWEEHNRRISGLEVIPLTQLGRPRIDVTVRISGFFRDAFPNLIDLMDQAFNTVINLDEPFELNLPRQHFYRDMAKRCSDGMPEALAAKVSTYRIFGSQPGTYGAGILPLIQEKNWQNDQDFAEAYLNWGGYAYTAEEAGCEARSQFCHLLESVEIALHNQDNREHDIFDSDDYLQFHGGMLATIRSLSGRNPRGYFGDTQDPSRAQVRDIKAEALRVFRSRVVNPKWIESIKNHGYKGAVELNATVDYLFGYDATAGVMEDWMYQEVTRAYILDTHTRSFLALSNPWALAAVSERLLEAMERGLWKDPDLSTKKALQSALLHSEALIESRGSASESRGVSP